MFGAIPFWYKIAAMAAFVVAIFFTGYAVAKHGSAEEIGKLKEQVNTFKTTAITNADVLREAVEDKNKLLTRVNAQNDEIEKLSAASTAIANAARIQMANAQSKYAALEAAYKRESNKINITPPDPGLPQDVQIELTQCRRAVEINNRFEETVK